MGFWDWLTNAPPTSSATSLTSGPPVVPAEGAGISYSIHSPRVEFLGGEEWADIVSGIANLTPTEMWKTQPHLRTVVSFIARNVSQLGLHTYRRVSETDRERDRTNEFARALANPGDGMTSYDLIFALVGDKMLFDRAYWLPWTDADGSPRIRRLPPSWVSQLKKNAFAVQMYRVSMPGGTVDVPAERLIVFKGYSPNSVTGCSPALDALKEVMQEHMESTKYRAQVWKRGGRTSAVITRPVDAPSWSDTAAERFREDWYANYTGDGPRAGGTPVLEDGMTINRVDFNAHDMQWAEGIKLSLATTASVFHVNPTMVGLLENANYSNVREFRKMLYGDTLGPYIAEFEAVVNTFALPIFRVPDTVYAEFNINEKLQGNFEEQTEALQSAVGRPWMTADEARAKQNMPSLGGDAGELVTPLNVLVGGQASPRDSAPDPEPGQEAGNDGTASHAGLRVKARASSPVEARAAQVVRGFFQRQEREVRSALGSKDGEDWWDEERWDKELGEDLFKLAVLVSGEVASSTLKAIGFEPDVYDTDRTLAWLKEVSVRSASSMNATTRKRLADALASDEDPTEKVDQVFAAQTARADEVAASTITLLSGFATVEATKQAVGEKATKTWRASGKNTRPDHAAMDGETVLLSENFSNGAAWPGDGSALGAEDIAGCNCELEIEVGEAS